MKRMILLGLIPLLAACATPRESCLRAATKDLLVVESLIAKTQSNLSRGYGVEREPYTSSTVTLCAGNRYRGGYYGGGLTYCSQPTIRYRNKPVTIDRATEQRKLKELTQTRARLLKQVEPRVEYCNIRYPAG